MFSTTVLKIKIKIACCVRKELSFIFFIFLSSNALPDILFSAKVMGPVSNIYSSSESGKIKKLTEDNSWRDLEASLKNNELLFLSNRKKDRKIELHKYTDTFNIYIKNLTTKKIEKITDNKHQKRRVQFSPNAKWITYIENSESSQDSLILINKNTISSKVIITGTSIYDYSWAQDNQNISAALIQGEYSKLVNINLSTKETSPLVLHSLEKKTLTQGTSNKLDSGSENIISSAQYSPNNKHIAYIQSPAKGDVRSLYLYNLKTKISKRLSGEKVQVQAPVDWNKSSDKILYSGLVGYEYRWDETVYKKIYSGSMHLYLSSINGKTEQLTKGEALNNKPRFSPDEKKVAFLYGESLGERDLELRVIDLKSKKSIPLHSPIPGYSYLQWSE